MKPSTIITLAVLHVVVFWFGFQVGAAWGKAAPDHVADASTTVDPAPVVEPWQPGEPFNAGTIVAEPTGRVR